MHHRERWGLGISFGMAVLGVWSVQWGVKPWQVCMTLCPVWAWSSSWVDGIRRAVLRKTLTQIYDAAKAGELPKRSTVGRFLEVGALVFFAAAIVLAFR